MTTRYTREHEWVRLDGAVATVGITDYAAEQLGDVVFVELPKVGKAVEKGGERGLRAGRRRSGCGQPGARR